MNSLGIKTSNMVMALIVIATGLFFANDANAQAKNCIPWTTGYSAGCYGPSSNKTAAEVVALECGGGSKADVQCKNTTDCSNKGKLCCQYKCEAIVTGSDDCAGRCVAPSDCDGGKTGNAASDPFAAATCANQTFICCESAVVTPEGDVAGTEDATSTSATDDGQVDAQVGSDCREKTTGLNFPCIASGNPTEVVAGVIARIVNWVLTLAGVAFLVMFVWGGIQYMIAGGDSGRADKARSTLVNAFIGTIIILGSYVILDYIFATLISAI